jgi:hypothetical protein
MASHRAVSTNFSNLLASAHQWRHAHSRRSFACLIVRTDLVVGSEVGTPAAAAFNVVRMGIIEPHSPAFI